MISKSLWSFRNRVDLMIRNATAWSLRRGPIESRPEDLRAAEELTGFLGQFDWNHLPSKSLEIVDIGCRNFFLAPALDTFFSQPGHWPRLHGVELDAHRRYSNLRTRAEFGHHYASTARNASFHAMDFLDWNTPADILLLLNPFVEPRSLLAWGLPLKHFRPDALFRHCHRTLNPGGTFLVCSPNQREADKAAAFAQSAGFAPRQTASWCPESHHVQRCGRTGTLFLKTPS